MTELPSRTETEARERVLERVLDAQRALTARRRARGRVVAAGAGAAMVLALAALLLGGRPGVVPAQPAVPLLSATPANELRDDGQGMAVIESDRTTVQRVGVREGVLARVSVTASQTSRVQVVRERTLAFVEFVDDRGLQAALAEAGLPIGIARVDGRTFVVANLPTGLSEPQRGPQRGL
jgi:hypothetical protein